MSLMETRHLGPRNGCLCLLFSLTISLPQALVMKLPTPYFVGQEVTKDSSEISMNVSSGCCLHVHSLFKCKVKEPQTS